MKACLTQSFHWNHICDGYEHRGKHTTAGFEWESEIKSCKALCAAYCSESLGDENNGIFPAAQH